LNVEEAPILRRCDRQRNTKEQVEQGEWIKMLEEHRSKSPAQKMFLATQNSNCDPRKRQPIRKIHKEGDSQSKTRGAKCVLKPVLCTVLLCEAAHHCHPLKWHPSKSSLSPTLHPGNFFNLQLPQIYDIEDMK
jgi:hypothetical protein